MLPTVPWYNGTKHILKLTTATGWDKNKSPPLLLREIQFCHFVPHKGSLVSPSSPVGTRNVSPPTLFLSFPPLLSDSPWPLPAPEIRKQAFKYSTREGGREKGVEMKMGGKEWGKGIVEPLPGQAKKTLLLVSWIQLNCRKRKENR